MIFISRPETNPYFNIAVEEYVLKNFSEDVLMLWQSEASVIVGKHQNALAEINLDFVRKYDIPVIRRISGGGTVFHGPGNLNYTLITTNQNRERLIDFQKFTKPVIDFLSSLGINAEFEGKNNLRIGEKKFSGNSAHVFKNRVLHHGTLLFDTDLDILAESIKAKGGKITDKAVQSVRAGVGNIKEHLPPDYSFSRFSEEYRSFLFVYFSIREIVELTTDQRVQIQEMVSEKYSQWDWNFGYSPAYTFRNIVDGLSLEVKVKNGVIQGVDFKDKSGQTESVLQELVGVKHNPDDIKSCLGSHFDRRRLEELLVLFGV